MQSIVPSWPSQGLESIQSCPICEHRTRKLLYSNIYDRINQAPGVWSLYKCLTCGSAHLDPRPDKNSIGIAYAQYYTHNFSSPFSSTPTAGFQRRLRNGFLNKKYGANLQPASKLGPILLPLIPTLKARAEHLFGHLPPTHAGNPLLLEIGCGSGAFLFQMQSLGWQTLGIESDMKAVQVAREIGVNVLHGWLENLPLPSASFDAITMHHVIEHLHDPMDYLSRCKQLLRKGGVLSLVTPNLDSLASRVFQNDWYALQPPNHLILFTPRSLVYALSRAGFERIKVHASSYGYKSMFSASKKIMPRLRTPKFYEALLTSDLFGFLAAVNPRLSEEVVITAHRP
jgi:SAM-dependent methyltransferase